MGGAEFCPFLILINLIKEWGMAEDKKKKVEEKKEEKVEQPASEQVEDLRGKDGEGVPVISKRGRTFYILPCSLFELPKLYELFAKWQTKQSSGATSSVESMKVMSEIIHFGIKEKHPDMTIEACEKHFTLSDFPKILKVMMDLNDFFAGMREINAMQTVMAKSVEK